MNRPPMQKAIGVDLGGSHVMAGVVSDDGEIGTRHEQELDTLAVDSVVKAVEDTVAKALADTNGKSVLGIGLGSPGNIDSVSGTILYSPNFQWKNVALGELLRKRFEIPVFVGNDARCATLGEYTFGIGRGTQHFVLLTLGTGIGGGIVSAGSLLLGNCAGAGEFGHHQIRPESGFVCNCGKIGCFEAQASGTGLIRHALAVAASFPRSALLGKDAGKLGSKAIRKAAQKGDLHALAAWNNFSDDLALGLANVIAFVNPELIALGGGVSSAGDYVLGSVRERVDQLTTMVPRGATRIEIAKLGNDAGAIGAAAMVFRGGLTTARAA
ncbi:MAG: ROK family protein [Candidatus Eremiobacteraeota bacterium]|nr:ROK family protein [Candidatus Eremiobacteraeota bacterium]